ncbi:DUF397 domain-containing protein [Kitasatospora sp. NBC_00240]|uniref:DUF397 domain-containing protein n=1 Tax=Kitasatospora sp. NBC_00240 TaxID=2903567 RepID=UPI00224D2105|nr:DUF397 domain-containing protein [Kitasatospora sp. NBC_00240]MCX5211222.1 DUF397 domain-containing protein [Kitasatospora sp. NBC_00240]
MLEQRWQKSSSSTQDGGNSVEVAQNADGMIEIRESDDPGSVVVTTPKKFALWLEGVKRGEFDHFCDDAG